MRPALSALLIALALPLCASNGQTELHPQTSGAAGTILFQDDFSKPANGWTIAKTDYAEFSYMDGEYRILLSKPDFNTYSILPKQKFDNASFEVDARLVSGPANGVFGILCRAEADERTASKAYIFAIRADGFYAILKRTSLTFWDAIATGSGSKVIKPGNSTNHLRADCSGGKLTFYINGEKALEKADSAFSGGFVGFAVTTQPKSEPLDVRFDNFVIRAIAP
jgi:3-keto-disaccharide hydrolase